MADEHYKAIKRSSLSFKGEDDKQKKKRRLQKADEVPGEPRKLPEDKPKEEDSVPLLEGTGRLVSNTVTVQGFDTKFKEEMEVGDTIMIHHPTSLEVEMRVVTGILSQRSCIVHQAFSKDLLSTTAYHIRKDSLRILEKAKAQIGEGGEAAAVQDAASQELQRQLEKRLKKQRKEVTIREKSGMWGYKIVTKKLDKEATQEELLDERCKQGRDRWCW